jgi:hypothetical protein
MSVQLHRTGCALLIPFLAAGCADMGGPSLQAGQGRVTLSITAGAAATSVSGAPAPETIELGGDVLVLEQIEIVLREIELELARGTDCRDRDRDDDCEEIEIGPVLVDLSPAGGPAHTITVPVPAGVYDEIEFEVHKPDDDTPEDRAFLQAHPDLRRVSIRVRGSFNGQPFTWITDLNEEQEVELSPPLVVEEGGDTDLVLMVDVRTWFRNGDRLVDPVTALKGQPNENRVRDNVRRAFRAFERD